MAVAQTWEKGEERKKGSWATSAEKRPWERGNVDDAKHARLFRRHLYIAAEDPALPAPLELGSAAFLILVRG
jgi:hypothetical protein